MTLSSTAKTTRSNLLTRARRIRQAAQSGARMSPNMPGLQINRNACAKAFEEIDNQAAFIEAVLKG